MVGTTGWIRNLQMRIASDGSLLHEVVNANGQMKMSPRLWKDDMAQKTVFIVIDGLGDRPIKDLNNSTPLESANTPNLDRLAEEGICGLMTTLGRGIVPGSDVAHLSLFGYEVDSHYCGRGPIEVAGLGMELLPGDIALRGNLGTVDHKLFIKDRRAGRIRDVSAFADALHGVEIDGIRFIIHKGTGHRVGVIMRGEGLSAKISDVDPHIEGTPVQKPVPLEPTKQAEFTASVIERFLERSHLVLSEHPVNKERQRMGLLPANYVLLRGAGQYKKVPTFNERYGMKAAVIAGAGLYKGIGSYVGMKVIDVPGATGLPDTDVEAKFRKAIDCIAELDFIFVHVKATDSLGEDGNFQGKVHFIEKIDKASQALFDITDALIVVTADHSTPCSMRSHSGDPVPIMIRGNGVRVDDVDCFGERCCSRGGLGLISGCDLMKELMNLTGRAILHGS